MVAMGPSRQARRKRAPVGRGALFLAITPRSDRVLFENLLAFRELESVVTEQDHGRDVLDIDAALEDLARLDPRHARLVELKFFAAASNQEIASALSVSLSTVEKDWRFIRSWLQSRLASSCDPETI